MKSLLAIFTIFAAAAFAVAQNEQAPILEKEIVYKDWTYRDIRTGEDLNLRKFTEGKKLTMVVYFAPWCSNWKHDAPILQRFYDKYQSKGLGIVAIGSYDPVPAMRSNLDALKITFPAVYESESRADKQKTLHYQYRRFTGDPRGWGSPWYIFLMPATMELKGDILTRRTFIINGEVIEAEGEKFIREKLGLAPTGSVVGPSGKKAAIEVCEPEMKIADLKRP
ncbi:MAG TPA: redoxin domain-containing protein [Pyrinomonadaceae bacterium]|nr:redoxin domain-containing protein [Pyrinomonadaceae bacterium]